MRLFTSGGLSNAGLAIVILGVAVGSAPIVFIGAAVILVRVLAEHWPRRVLEKLHYERSVHPAKTVVGEEVEMHLSLWNRSRLPIAWATSHDTLGRGLQTNPRELELVIAGPMRPFERITRRVRVTPMRRGVHEIGPVSVGVEEHFGTHHPSIDTPDLPTTILARPLMAPVVGATPAVSPLAQVKAKRSLYTDPTLFAGVRPFQTGDPLRSVHWRASARQRALQTKRYEPALSRQQVIVFDVQTVAGPYWMLNYDEDLFEELCITAISIARDLILKDASVGFAAAGFTGTTQRFAYLPPRADRAQIERIGDLLARLTPESSAPLTQLLAWLPHKVAKGTGLVVLSGLNPRPSAPVVKRLQQSGFPVHFVLLRDDDGGSIDAHRLGIPAAAGSVQMSAGKPRAVVLSG